MRIVIIGNGVLALTTAYRLVQKLKALDEIVIIANPQRPYSATMVAPAMLNSYAELEADSLLSHAGQVKFQMSIEATKQWPGLLAEITKSASELAKKLCGYPFAEHRNGWFDKGTFIINNTASDELDDENFNAIVNALVANQEPFQWVNYSDIPNYAPQQQFRSIRAIYIENEGWFNPRILVELLDSILATHPQVKFIHQNVNKLVKSERYISHVETEDGNKVNGDKFLLAAGSSTTDLITASQLDLYMQRVFHGVGATLQIHSPEYPHQKCIRTPNRGLACGLYTTPYYQGPDQINNHIAVGASNFVSPKPTLHARLTSVSTLMNGIIEQINSNFYKAELIRVNVGIRPLSQDGYPLIGQSSIPNLHLASGTRREGLHLSPVISDYLAKLIYSEPVDSNLAIFSPERSLICDLSRDAAIQKGVKHAMSAIYQHGFVPSDESLIKKLKDKYYDDLHRVHDQSNALEWGIPPDMIDMYRYGHANFSLAPRQQADEKIAVCG